LSKQRSSYGHHRCVTHFIGIPLFIFYYAIDYAIDCAIDYAILIYYIYYFNTKHFVYKHLPVFENGYANEFKVVSLSLLKALQIATEADFRKYNPPSTSSG
jgi:hypothetical protein